MKKFQKLMQLLRMRENLTVFVTSFCGLFSINMIDITQLTEVVKFSGQTVIGILTIIYLVIKIKKIKK
jgi:hypothetical protein